MTAPAAGTGRARTFDLPATGRVVYGPGAADHTPEELRRIGVRRPLVVASRTLATTTSTIAELAGRIGAAGVFHGVPAHVPQPAVLEIAQRYRDLDADGLVSIGGGSPIDAAKGAALCLAEGIADEAAARAVPHPLPTSGPAADAGDHGHASAAPRAGNNAVRAEFTAIVGITDPTRGAKDLYAADALCPGVVLLDPGLAAHTPRRFG